MKICAMTCLHNLALGMIGGSLDKKRFPRNTIVEEQGKEAVSLKAELKARINTSRQAKQAKLGLRFMYMCVRACVRVYVSHTQIYSVTCNLEESVASAFAVCLLRVTQVLCRWAFFIVTRLSEI